MRAASWNAEAFTFDVILGVGATVPRRDQSGAFDEVLDLAGARFPERIPLLDSHRRGSLDDQIGSVSNIRLEAGQLVGTARLSKHSPMAQRVAAELSDGAKFGVSIGYSVSTWAETKPAGRRTLTAKAFDIVEASLVSIPADASATIRNAPLTTTTTEPAVQTRAEINSAIRSAAKAAGLGQDFIDTHIDSESDLATVNAAALAALSSRSATTGAIRTTAAVGVDHNDPAAIRSAMADALAHRLAPTAVKLEGRATEYRSLTILDMAGDMAVARGERVNLRDREELLQRAVGAHSTSDFPLLVADATNKALLAQYAVAAPTYRRWSARKQFSDFRAHSFLRLGDLPEFKPIPENGGVKYGTISESGEKISAQEYTSGIAFGRRVLMSDDLSALADFAAMYATRAAADENRLAYNVLKGNRALSDGKAIFHADHGNLVTGSAIDAAGMKATISAIRGQKSIDGLSLNLQPAFLVVGPAQEVAARQLLAAVAATKTSDVNIWAGIAELVVDAEITDNRWFLFASPAVAPVVVHGHVAGAEGPQVRTERDFETQALKVAAGLDFAVGAIDFRGAVSNPGV